MRKTLQLLALFVILAAVITWVCTGADRGWTKTSVPVKTVDPVTQIEGISYQKKFIAGVDFLGASFIGAAVLAGTSFLFRKSKINQSNKQQQ
jgi:hypothetical protein